MKKPFEKALGKKIVGCLTVASFMTLQGCSAFKSATQMVNIQCTEQDTTVMINGQTRKCPLQMEVKRDRDLSLQAHKYGYAPYMRTIGHHFSTTGVLDVVGTCLILLPGIGLFTSGAWDLDETDITIQLIPSYNPVPPVAERLSTPTPSTTNTVASPPISNNAK